MKAASAVQNVDAVVANYLCTGCGACVAVCPQDAVGMVETAWGALYANRDGARCVDCGLCAAVCPGWHLEEGTLPQGVDPFTGRVLAAYICQATDRRLLADAQSGGVATVLLYHLLESNEVDRAIVTQMPEDGTLRPRVLVTGDRQEIAKACGSKYCPVPLNAALKTAIRPEEKLALVGLGCHIHALRNAQVHGLHKSVRFSIGLICSGVGAYGHIDHLIGRAGLSRAQVVGFRFKSKKWQGWPGDVAMRTRDGVEHNLLRAAFVSSRSVFAPPCCRLCFDQLNVLSDVSVGDAHHLSDDPAGASLVLVRTQAGLDALGSAASAGVLKLTPVEMHEAFGTCQTIELRRQAWTAYTRLWRQSQRMEPDFGIEDRWAAHVTRRAMAAYRRKLMWTLRVAGFGSPEQARRAQERRALAEELLASAHPVRLAKRLKRILALSLRALRPPASDHPGRTNQAAGKDPIPPKETKL